MATPADQNPEFSDHDPELIVRRDGNAGWITLNRPKALNALTDTMVHAIHAALVSWRSDDRVSVIIIDAAGDKAFAAGGDVRALYDSRPGGAHADPSYHTAFWRDEYRLNAAIKHYPKPIVAMMHGIVMGGGIGISAHASHRIVTEGSRVAMPETGIGLIPDVGGSYLLANAPGQSGVFCALTGHVMNAADALYTGFADVFCDAASRHTLFAEIAAHGSAGLDEVMARLADMKPHIDGQSGSQVESALKSWEADIDKFFIGHDVGQMVEALITATEPRANDWGRLILTRSPTALKAALASIRIVQSRGLSLDQALMQEYRTVRRLYAHGDFLEGIRALVIDKDKKPQWTPSHLDQVSDEDIKALSTPFDDRCEGDEGELTL